MSKEAKARKELIGFIQDELRNEADCHDIHLKITKGDNEGAFWAIDISDEKVATHPCFSKAVTIAKRLAKRYNVAR